MNDLEQSSYQGLKSEIKSELNRVAESFVVIGYKLKQVRDGELYRQDGYNNIHEFAKEEYGLSQSNTSRFIAINDKYSMDGGSTKLLERFDGYGYSKLSEMLTLSDDEIKLISVKTTVAEIRDVKQVKREAENEIYATSHNSESLENTQSEQDFKEEKKHIIPEAEKLLIAFFRERNRRGMLKELADLFRNHGEARETIKQAAEIINPSGYLMFKNLFTIMTFEEQVIKYNNFKSGTKEFTYSDFIHDTCLVFDMTAIDPALEFYGEPEPEPELEKPAPKQEEKTSKADTKKTEPAKPIKPAPTKPKEESKIEPVKEPEEEQKENAVDIDDDNLPGQAHIDEYPEYQPEHIEGVEIVEADIVENASEGCLICSKSQYTIYSTKELIIELSKHTREMVVTQFDGEKIKKIERRPIKYCPDCGRKYETME